MFPILRYNPIYDMKELMHSCILPMRVMALAGKNAHDEGYNPLTHSELGRKMSASLVMVERMTRDYPKPAFGIHNTTVDGHKVAIEQVTLKTKTFCNLLHFKKKNACNQPKLLLIAPMSGHHATLLRGTVKGLLPYCDVYITDWVNAREIPVDKGSFDLDDFIDYITEFMEDLAPNLHVMGVCQPAVPLLAATAIMEAEGNKKRPDSIVLIGGPIDVRKSPTEINNFAEDRSIKWFEQKLITRVPYKFDGYMRQVYPGFMQLSGFMAMNMNRHIGEFTKLFGHLVDGDGDGAIAHKRFYNEYLAVMDLPSEFYLQTIETVFQTYALPRGKMVSRGRKVDPAAIKNVKLLTIEGERDDISGIGQTKAALKLCRNLPNEMKNYHLQKSVGHYGLFNGRRFNEEIVPVIVDFIKHKK